MVLLHRSSQLPCSLSCFYHHFTGPSALTVQACTTCWTPTEGSKVNHLFNGEEPSWISGLVLLLASCDTSPLAAVVRTRCSGVNVRVGDRHCDSALMACSLA